MRIVVVLNDVYKSNRGFCVLKVLDASLGHALLLRIFLVHDSFSVILRMYLGLSRGSSRTSQSTRVK